MGFLDMLYAASMPILKVLIVTALGSFLALESIDILGQSTSKQLNRLVFYVFSPALVGSILAKTITLKNIISMWFLPVNILLTFIIGSALGWALLIILRPPQHLKGLVIGSCAAGNIGNMMLIIIPAVCKEKASPFGDSDVCYKYGMAYASVSTAIGMILLWTYVYNIVQFFSVHSQDSGNNVVASVNETRTIEIIKESTPQLASSNVPINGKPKQVMLDSIKKHLGSFSRQFYLKAVFAPPTIGAVQYFITLDLDAAIPAMTLLVGGNLLKGLKGSGISLPLVCGIAVVRLVFSPIIGIFIVKGALHLGLVHADPLYLFVLYLQFALPPAMNIGTITQLFGAGEGECSVIMLWCYGLALLSLTLWSVFFMWLVA
ncbi:auxin efflux carrier family protein [Artemisia annua]|uniref:Auxin efflux carrier family protein n=1 Tax=Artemisia annua TaxID=35608 RepID=A0A2U1PSY5_ARTAN|nr:auxin efflux carrier family protein [Artemisia annua]